MSVAPPWPSTSYPNDRRATLRFSGRDGRGGTGVGLRPAPCPDRRASRPGPRRPAPRSGRRRGRPRGGHDSCGRDLANLVGALLRKPQIAISPGGNIKHPRGRRGYIVISDRPSRRNLGNLVAATLREPQVPISPTDNVVRKTARRRNSKLRKVPRRNRLNKSRVDCNPGLNLNNATSVSTTSTTPC